MFIDNKLLHWFLFFSDVVSCACFSVLFVSSQGNSAKHCVENQVFWRLWRCCVVVVTLAARSSQPQRGCVSDLLEAGVSVFN